jgi:hypothetical protein
MGNGEYERWLFYTPKCGLRMGWRSADSPEFPRLIVLCGGG